MTRQMVMAFVVFISLTLAFASGMSCVDGSEPTNQDFDDLDIGLMDDDNGLEPSAVNPNAPTAPSSLTAQVMAPGRIDLAWNDNSSNETGFKVYSKKGGGSFVLIASLAPGAEAHSATGLKSGKTYGFKVVAYNSYGKATSNIVSTLLTPPGMALIPAGCFDMGGSENGCFYSGPSCPIHKVCLTANFYMDRHEVTNEEYRACVSGGGCTAPGATTYYGDTTYDSYPVAYVNWNQATAYCVWAGKRLPTEAQWEYAARGGMVGKAYPWGDAISSVNSNYWNGNVWYGPSPVEYYAPNGYGLYDVSGNVWEWVSDWYDSTYYSVSPVKNPVGPAFGVYRGLRGGSWGNDVQWQRVDYRGQDYPPATQDADIGFRCAGD